MEERTHRLQIDNLIAWSITVISLYILSLKNYLLFHTLVELFSVLIAYIVFLIIWKSKGFISNRYLIFVGVAYFFIGSYDLLHTLTFTGIVVFPGLDINTSTQFWIIARYLESISLLIAPLLLTQKNNEMNDLIFLKNPVFIKRIFVIYSIITGYLLISVLYLKNFPTCYIEGSGVTPFKIMSESVISFVLLCSLVLLYTKKDKFERKVFNLLTIFIIFTLLGEMPFLVYSHMDEFSSLTGHFFKVLSFYCLYLAIVEKGFDEPYRFTREIIQREEVLKQEAAFLTNEQDLIFSLFGMKKNIFRKKSVAKNLYGNEEDYRSLIQNFSGILFQLDKYFLPVLIEGAIEEITGYSKEDFLSKKVKWVDIVIPEYLQIISKNVEFIDSEPKAEEKEYKIRRKDGEIRWVVETLKEVPGNGGKYLGSIHDITQRKIIEKTLEKQENARLKEIHHRIKNNLQVISSLLDLQAEKFHDKKVIQAFKESQNRVISMALIHEELYNGNDMDTLDFADYLQKLAVDLFNSYRVGNENIRLKLELKHIHLGMDTAIPLGIIVNELISNSLKYAFQPGRNGKINLSLYRIENYDEHKNYADSRVGRSKSENNFQYTLVVADNGSGIPKEIDIEDADSLGLQIISILVDQIEGHLELKRDLGTEFRISFNNK